MKVIPADQKEPTPDEHLEVHPLLEFGYIQNTKVVKDQRPEHEKVGELQDSIQYKALEFDATVLAKGGEKIEDLYQAPTKKSNYNIVGENNIREADGIWQVRPKTPAVLKTGIPIFIGASDQKCDRIQEKILTYTLQKNSTEKLDITFLRPSMFPGVSSMGWGTPFTGLRYVIPKLMNFEGKAIYMDMDMVNLRDIADFYNINLYGKPFGMVWDSKCSGTGGFCDSMMLMDCNETRHFWNWEEVYSYNLDNVGFKWKFLDRLKKYEEPEHPLRNQAVIRIDSRWNSFDGTITDGVVNKENKLPMYELERIFHLHLTALSYQPWHSSYLMAAKATHMRSDISDYWWQLVDEVNSIEI
jgi:hypothetical protein